MLSPWEVPLHGPCSCALLRSLGLVNRAVSHYSSQGRFATREEVAAMKAEAAALTATQADDALMPSPFAASFEDPLASASTGLEEDVCVPVLGLA